MAINIKVNGDGTTTLTLAYTAASDKVTETLAAAAHWLYDHGRGDHGDEETPLTWDDLTNAQKLAIIDVEVRSHLIECAKAYNVNTAADAARVAELAADRYL